MFSGNGLNIESEGGAGGSGIVIVRITNWKSAYEPVEVPTAVDDLVYDGTEQTGVEEGEGYTLEDNTATDAGSYTATATLKDGYCWADGKTEQKTIDWSIGKFAITVTPVATNKLVGAEDPELTYTTDVEPVEGDEFTGKLARSEGEDVGTYNITQGALTLAGDIFVGDRADVTTEVLATNVVLAANVTVGAATKGLDPAGIAVLAFDEIDVDDYKLTLTTNGVVQSATVLDIDEVFAEVEHFHVAEKAIAGGFEYTLEATEFYVKYYDGDEVVHSNKFTILNYMTDLHIWNGNRTGLVFLGYKKENGEALAVTDEALRAYVKDEADDPGCDGEVKVFGTWVKPIITIHVKADEETITGVWSGEDEVANDDLELPADATEVELTLEANVNLTVPVFKVVRGNVTNVTTKVETYAIADGDTLEFFAEEADETDPTVTDDDIKTALIESIDDLNPDVCEAAEKKVNDVVGTGAKQVSARGLAAYINKNGVQSFQIADCDYVAASVKLDTDSLIDEDTEVEIAELVKAEGNALTFTVDIDSDPVNVEAIKDMVEASSDLIAWNDHILEVTATFEEGEEGDAGKVTITPKDPTDKAFMKVVIPKDPGVE